MKKRIVILGGGTAGTAVANKLGRKLGDLVQKGEMEILLISNAENHIYQPGYLFVVFNEKALEHFTRKQNTLVHRNVTLILDEVVKVDLENKRLLSENTHYDYDLLVIATGSHPDFDSIPGLKEIAHSFYTSESAERLRDALVQLERGKILITMDVPHKCPAAPLEITLMLDDYFRRRNMRDLVEIMYTYPIGRIHALQPVADWALPEFEKRNIQYETYFNMEAIDSDRKVVLTMDGMEHPFDLLITIPAHKGAPVIMNSGIGDELGFIPTNRHTLKLEGNDDVYVIGDATNLPISKAGSTAHYQGESLVENLVNRVKGLPETSLYNGKVACFLENSLSDASYITFDYQSPPKPANTSEKLHWFKAVYNELYWLATRGIM